MFMRATTLFPSGVSSPGSPLISIANVFATSLKADKRARTWPCLCLLAAVYFVYKSVGFLRLPRANGWTDDHRTIPGHSVVNGAFTIGEPSDIVGKWKSIRSPVGWSSSADGIIVIGDNCDSWGGLSPRVSKSFIGLQGRNAYIEQSLALDPLKNYTITFHAAVRPGHSPLQVLEVKAAGVRVWIGSPASASLSDTSMQPYTVTFAPRVSDVTLRFVNMSPTHIGDNAIFLDDVSIQSAHVPGTCELRPSGILQNTAAHHWGDYVASNFYCGGKLIYVCSAGPCLLIESRRYLFYHSGQEAWLVGKPGSSCSAMNGRSQPSATANQAWAEEFAGWHVVSTRTNCRSSMVPKDLGEHLTNSITLTAIPPGIFKESAPFVTFVIASKGRGTLKRTLRSLIQQADPSWQAIVCFDDVSASKQQNLNLPQDPRIIVMHTGKKLGTNGNHAAAVRNLAASNVKTEWTAYLDDDDTASSTYVSALKEEIEKASKPDAVVFRILGNLNGIVVPPHAHTKTFERLNVGMAFAMRTRFFHEGFAWRPSPVEDFDLLNDMRNQHKRIVMSPYLVYFHRAEPLSLQ